MKNLAIVFQDLNLYFTPGMAQLLDADKAERKVWIVRVPPYVAQRWHEAIDRSGNAELEDDAAPEVLGQVSIEQGLATILRVPGEGDTAEGVTLHMNAARDAVDSAILSYEPSAAGSMAAPKVDGVVHKRYDAAPVKMVDVTQATGAGVMPDKRDAGQRQQTAVSMQVDAAYLQNSRKRLAAAAAKPTSRKVVMIEDVKTAQQLEGAQTISLWSQKRDAKQKSKPREAREEKRRVRMARDDLEQELFKHFEKQPHWHFVALQKELDQPAAYLKEVLNEVATQVKRGPHKDLWELKKHLATGS